MNLHLALTGSLAGHFVQAALVFVMLKLGATVLLLVILRGNYRQLPPTFFARTVYLVGKVAPALAAASACVAAALVHDRTNLWLMGCVTVISGLAAFYAMRLRHQGRFFGVLDGLSKKPR